MALIKLLIFLQIIIAIGSTNINIANIEKKILDQIFSPANYDKRIRPRSNGTTEFPEGPVNVTAIMFIRSLTFMDEEKQRFGMDVSFRQEWTDDRLKYDDANRRLKYLTLTSTDMIWTPILAFRRNVKGYLHMITTPNILVRIYSDGRVLLSQRFNLQIEAKLNYYNYPFDRQELTLEIYNKVGPNDLILQWQHYDPVIKSDLSLPLFTIEKIEVDRCGEGVASEPYSFLILRTTVTRKLYYYLMHVFLPCNMFVIAGYVSFWLDLKFVTGRVILSVSTLYSLATTVNTLNSQLPKVYYTKLIDIFMGMCLAFVFSTLIELVVAQAFENCANRNNSVNEEDQNLQQKTFNVKRMKQWLQSTPINKIDAIFRIAYPIAYITFLVLYIIAVCI